MANPASDATWTQLVHTKRLASELARGQNGNALELWSTKADSDGLSFLCILTTSRGVIIEVNRTAASFLNVEIDVLRGKSLLTFVARGDTRPFRGRLRTISEAPIEPIVAHLRPRHGTPRRMYLMIEHVARSSRLLWTAGPGPELFPGIDARLR
jgi:PAS domain-containing protein